MPAFNFKYRFARKVETGDKLHTIRARRKDGKRPMVGQAMHAYEGMRTKKCRPLVLSTISNVEWIRIEADGRIRLGVPGDPAVRTLTVDEAHALAIADGFTSATELYEFFKAEHGLPFEGDLIHWRFPSQGGDVGTS